MVSSCLDVAQKNLILLLRYGIVPVTLSSWSHLLLSAEKGGKSAGASVPPKRLPLS